MDGRHSRSAQAPTDTHTAPKPKEVVPFTPLIPQGGPSPNAARVPAVSIATAVRALASPLATSLPADQMEVLLNLIIQKEDNTTTTVPAPSLTPATGNPPLSSFSPAVTSLQIRFPTGDPIYFKEILKNRFRSENLIKLSSTFMQPPRRQQSITLGSFTISTSERDGDASEYRGLASITQPLGIYIQALLHFCPDSVERELGHALHLCTDLLHTINRSHTLESLKTLHFTFHRKRMALGLYDPMGWRDRDGDLQQMILVRRDPPAAASTKRPFDKAFTGTKTGGNPQATDLCNNWNEGRCHGFCKYKHACKSCGGTHPASQHASSQAAPAASGSNAVIIRPKQ